MPVSNTNDPVAPSSPRVADLHCDLLAYLVMGDDRTADDPAPRCALPQLRAGQVGLQTLAIFTLTNDDAPRLGVAQAQAFADVVAARPTSVVNLGPNVDRLDRRDGRIGLIAAIENASGFCAEDEPLDRGLERLVDIETRVGGLLYVSLTWNQANRFGGGCAEVDVGLRDDGRVLLDFLEGRGTAIDLSHASPRLADEVLDRLAARGSNIPVCASHSCFRALNDVPRNLPDTIARGIAERNGVIGLNGLRTFLGPGTSAAETFADQYRHAVDLGVDQVYGLGTDFFAPEDVPAALRASMPDDYFFDDCANASAYPGLLDDLTDRLGFDDETRHAFAAGRIEDFVRRVRST